MTFENDPAGNWLAAQLKPNGLKAAQLNLSRQSFQSLMPSLRVTKRVGGRVVRKSEPLFPGYVFVKIDQDSAPWQKINSTLGISRLILNVDGAPAIVPAEFIQQLQGRLDEDGQIKPLSSIPTGTKVQITSGPFTEWFAEVEACKKGERVDLLLSFMGRVVRTNTSLHEVKTV